MNEHKLILLTICQNEVSLADIEIKVYEVLGKMPFAYIPAMVRELEQGGLIRSWGLPKTYIITPSGRLRADEITEALTKSLRFRQLNRF